MTLKIIKEANNSKLEKNSEKKGFRRELFTQGLIAGMGWAVGVTLGFVLISVILAFILSNLGGVPLIGKWTASIVEATLDQLGKRTPFTVPQ